MSPCPLPKSGNNITCPGCLWAQLGQYMSGAQNSAQCLVNALWWPSALSLLGTSLPEGREGLVSRSSSLQQISLLPPLFSPCLPLCSLSALPHPSPIPTFLSVSFPRPWGLPVLLTLETLCTGVQGNRVEGWPLKKSMSCLGQWFLTCTTSKNHLGKLVRIQIPRLKTL